MGPRPATDRLEAKQLRVCLLSKLVVILRQKSKDTSPRREADRFEAKQPKSVLVVLKWVGELRQMSKGRCRQRWLKNTEHPPQPGPFVEDLGGGLPAVKP